VKREQDQVLDNLSQRIYVAPDRQTDAGHECECGAEGGANQRPKQTTTTPTAPPFRKEK